VTLTTPLLGMVCHL